MNNSMISALVSMTSMQQRLDVIANNVANVDTVGYKSKQASFEDVLTGVQQQGSTLSREGRATPLGYNMGFGVQMTSVTQNMAQGELNETGSPTDLAIEGNALFAVEVDGQKAWTRAGNFHFVPDESVQDPNAAPRMRLVTTEGYSVLGRNGQPITTPANATAVAFDANGNVLVRLGDSPDATVAGQLQLVEPIRPEGLAASSNNLFSLVSGATEDLVFGQNAATTVPEATIRAGYLETSNVDLTSEMTKMLEVQRTYQLAARALSSSDTMMNLANNMRA
ncbi:flagellar hook-basal body protein [Paenibacillus sp. Marseille-Q4541]|uniref:flagellar hook-basal body protein n=1 Tax=Paenibacillus sp. Marseille-Q4541 TaxID=2831522 RepID=UPI001BA6F598|nr:flagellar hook-basal body protein [Paenibacillus sp. Marseille-Q4541]